MNDSTLDLLTFFKALADPTRLKIAGRLAEARLTADELAAQTGETRATIARHTARLMEAGLISVGKRGFELRLDRIRALAAQVAPHSTATAAEDVADFDRKVLESFLTPEGALKEMPVQEKKLIVILHYLRDQFEPGRSYTEKEVNTLLARYHPDPASLRRAMIDRHLLERDTRGTEYRRSRD